MQMDTSSCMHHRLSQWLVGVLLDNKRYKAVVEDVGYDRSTWAVSSRDGYQMADYDTVGEILDNEFTGQTVATYCSGSGLAAQTLREAANEIASEALSEWLGERLPGLYDRDDKIVLEKNFDFDSDAVFDALTEIGTEYGFVEVFASRPLIDVWNKHLSAVLGLRAKDREKAQIEALERQRVETLVEAAGRPLLTQLNVRWQGMRFENATATEFWSVLNGLRKSGMKLEVAAALRLSGQSFSLSHSVRAAALHKYKLSL